MNNLNLLDLFMGVDAIGFDIDGTTVDTSIGQLQTINEWLAVYGFKGEITKDIFLKEIMQLNIPARVKYATDDIMLTIEDKAAAEIEYARIAASNKEQDTVYDGFSEVVDWTLLNRKEIFFLTSASKIEVEINVRNMEKALGYNFNYSIITAEDVNCHKPHHEGIEKSLQNAEKTKGGIKNYLYMGDSQSDIQIVINANKSLDSKGTPIFIETSKKISSFESELIEAVEKHFYANIKEVYNNLSAP